MRRILLLCLLATGLSGQNTPAPVTYPAQSAQAQFLGDIPPLRSITPHTAPDLPPATKTYNKYNYFGANDLRNPKPQPQGADPLLAASNPSDRSVGLDITPSLNIEGLRDPFGVSPPDPCGDVGKNHYVQMVNSVNGSWFQIWDKQGQSVYGPAMTSTIWSQVNTGSRGDPIIQYDHSVQRWLMLELKGINQNELLLAVSNNSDPTGGWKAYVLPTLGFPDYPKLYVWDNAYFITVNEITDNNKCAGYALEKSGLLAGSGQFGVYRFEFPNFLGINFQPATGVDWEGGPPPPAGTPVYVLRVYDDAWDGGQDQLQLWEVNLNWQDVNQSNATGPISLFPAPFETKVCFGFFDCLEQSSPNAPRITAFENSIMYRAPYRRFADHESIVLNHVADVSGQTGPGGDAAVRWYELRRSGGGPWSIYQQGTYAPDAATNRFTGTISMDDVGNIALGYSALNAGNFVFPGLRLTGRREGDPPGTLPINEYVLKAGEKDSPSERWGDYSSMNVDPEDDRTFWFTGEYQPSNGAWGTRIASFRVQRDTYDLTPVLITAPQPSATLGNAESVKVSVLNAGLVNASGAQVSLYLDGVLVGTDNIAGTIAAGGALEHTFGNAVNLSQVGKVYHFMVITHWNPDTYAKNDTLRQDIRHLTSQDASAAGRANFPGLICGNTFNLEFVLQNAGQTPLQSAQINWKINGNIYQTMNWSGLLQPGERDTIPLPVTGVLEGANFFYAHTALPNGNPDQDIHNDSLFFKFFGNLDGAYVEAYTRTDFGVLELELRRFNNNQLILSRTYPPSGAVSYYLCTEDNTCYKLVLRSSTLAWEGQFVLLDIFGDTLVQTTGADADGSTFTFCTPVRKNKDVGAWGLQAPQSSPGLGAAETVTMQFRNLGLSTQNTIQVAYRVNGGPWHNETYSGAIGPGETLSHTFGTTEDLSVFGNDYVFDVKATVDGDEIPENDQRSTVVRKNADRDAAITALGTFVACNSTTGVVLKMTVKNNGLQPLDKATVLMRMNGVEQPPQEVDLNLAANASAEVLFSGAGVQLGANVVEVNLTNAGAPGEDFQPLNDTLSAVFFIDSDRVPLSVSVFTDGQPNETTWELRDVNDAIVASGGPYTKANSLYFEPLCLNPPPCYRFLLKDSGNNGMDGFVQLESGGIIADNFFGGNFGDSLNLIACVVATTDLPGAEAARIWPNPTTGMVWLDVPAAAEEQQALVQVYQANGQLVQVLLLHRWNDRLKGGFSLEKSIPGVYTVQVLGKKPLLQRVIKN
jgi:hypothetical protein